MTTKTMNLPKPREGSHLASYISYFSEKGLDLYRFVEAGGRLVGREDSAGLRSGLADLRGKISELRPGARGNPRSAVAPQSRPHSQLSTYLVIHD